MSNKLTYELRKVYPVRMPCFSVEFPDGNPLQRGGHEVQCPVWNLTGFTIYLINKLIKSSIRCQENLL